MSNFPSQDVLLRQLNEDRTSTRGVHAQSETAPKVDALVKSLSDAERHQIGDFMNTLTQTGDIHKLGEIVENIPQDRREAFTTGLRLEMEREGIDGPYNLVHVNYDEHSGNITMATSFGDATGMVTWEPKK